VDLSKVEYCEDEWEEGERWREVVVVVEVEE